jgi:preprotein translocase subunit SecE
VTIAAGRRKDHSAHPSTKGQGVSTPDDAGADSEGVDPDGAQGASRSAAPAGKSADPDTSSAGSKKGKKGKSDQPGIFARFAKFLRQVVAELRKVIWPTRSELINYATVVLVFVVIMAVILAAYDFAFARVVFFVFGE